MFFKNERRGSCRVFARNKGEFYRGNNGTNRTDGTDVGWPESRFAALDLIEQLRFRGRNHFGWSPDVFGCYAGLSPAVPGC